MILLFSPSYGENSHDEEGYTSVELIACQEPYDPSYNSCREKEEQRPDHYDDYDSDQNEDTRRH
jgi:hypothetical protein